MPTTLAKVDLFNLALAHVGAQLITDPNDTSNPSAVECNTNWQLALASVARSHPWNCLMVAAQLQPTAQTPIVPVPPGVTSTPWAPLTAYAANVFVTYGNALYQALIANTSTNSFINDLTAGFWFETDLLNIDPFNPNSLGSNYASGWAYQYPLPQDCLLVYTYNDQPMTSPEKEWEIIGINLYSDMDTAVIHYVQYNEDCTRYDGMFTDCLVLKLASMIATRLRQDDTQIAQGAKAEYLKQLSAARTRDANERRSRRFVPQQNSNLIRSRYFSTNR